ncbi:MULTISPECIES: TraK family protein [Desulfovibrionaceae]|uniref:TraK family protein n=1 Tax=Desulfovibrionaceae TaxID=194924 RepID=UPI0035200415
MSGKPLRHNMAKVEFLGCLESVTSMLAQGFSKRIIYERLLEEKRLSMAYVTFCKLSAKVAKPSLPIPFQSNDPPAPAKAASPPPLARQDAHPGPRIVNTAKDPFPNPRDMRPEDGI